MSLVYYLDLCAQTGCDGVMLHIGSLRDTTKKEGFKKVIEGINWILNRSNTNAILLLEIRAGSGKIIGSRLEDLAYLRNNTKQRERVLYCLDTQHMFASGYDLVNNLDEVVTQIDKILDLQDVKAIHLNDSKSLCGSNIDRHENLGEGKIGTKAMRRIVNHPKLLHVPFIIETPALRTIDGAKSEIKKLKNWIK